ncbi:MBL fold metallo-hydrolase [uncultured Oscillibacter sp.]|uniref:MBL fold metallo-hydrolase n=1 Tax=uncultured Oscillibacter sp. TaxID=876091 RepID=UPI0028049454|nr:MBL fold metallo-hydrolase [uncultured Oscillibacter sp.]
MGYVVDASYFAPKFRNLAGIRKQPFCIAGNLYYVGNALVSSHLIDTGEGLILIDTAFPQTRSLLIQSIWEMGFDPKDIRYIVHSHGHVDHIGGTNLLKDLSGAKTVLHQADAAMFREDPRLTFDCDQEFPYSSLFQPDIEIRDGDTLTLGNTTLRFRDSPGHTAGVVAIFLETQHRGKRYTAAMQGGAGLNTLCREHFERYEHPQAMQPRRDAFEAGLKRLLDVPVDIPLGNHPNQNHTFEKLARRRADPGGPDPFIDPGEWRRYLTQVLDGFYNMVADGD